MPHQQHKNMRIPSKDPRVTTSGEGQPLDEVYDMFRASLGLERVEDKNAYAYSVHTSAMNTDPFIRKALKQWCPATFSECKGYTKRTNLVEALLSTLGFDRTGAPSKPNFTQREAKIWEKVKAKAISVFVPEEPLIRISLANAADETANSAAAGFSFPGRKKNEVVQEVFDIASYMQHMIQKRYWVYTPPAKMACRGHLHKEGTNKTRAVWMFPYEIIMMESKWAVPYTKYLERKVRCVHFGDGAMQRLATHLRTLGENEVGLTLDWSSYDTTVVNQCIDDAFDIVEMSFDDAYVSHDGNVIYQGDKGVAQNSLIWGYLRTYFKRTKIMLPNGDVYRKKSGIPSGSMFTQIIGSIVNYMLVSFTNECLGLRCYDIKVLGDDSDCKTPKQDFLAKVGSKYGSLVGEIAGRCFGMTLHPEKVRIATKVSERSFLGYTIKRNSFVRDDDAWFKAALYAEHDVDNLMKSASRMLAFYVLGGCMSAAFSQFFHYYFGVYPQVTGKEIRTTRSVRNIMKYVLRIDSFVGKFPDLSRLSFLGASLCLSTGAKIFR